MNEPRHRASGWHLLADLSGIAPFRLKQLCELEMLLLESARVAGAHVLSSHFHAFGAGQGVTGIVLLAESHISIHTWPEEAFAAIDIFMCGESKPRIAFKVIEAGLEPNASSVRVVRRSNDRS